jgi:acyl-coenzyme A thioesterase 13
MPMSLEQLQAILDHPRGGFSIDGLQAVEATRERLVVRLEVTQDLTNMANTLHGGAAATLIDIVGSLAIVLADRHNRPGVTTDLSGSWYAPAPLGTSVIIEATVPKIGKTMAFTSVDIKDEAGKVLVHGTMTKALGQPPTVEPG